ncbi:hypothetical protein B0H15DRAFT_804277 [Mycena belliarum]|uniref:Uncharacterized protein n=1 Tax=Mycena belliarum TaxID=1033014 RepID=A0AAD6TXF1_9AGAR|nr:hypothetical protein B0H15DRAFT_804277 [Mycena belliae]
MAHLPTTSPETETSVSGAASPQGNNGVVIEQALAALQSFFSAAIASMAPAPTSTAAAATPASPAVQLVTPAAAAPAMVPGGFLTHGPWVAGSVYAVVPTGPLGLVAEDAITEQAEYWYCITRGLYVGVTISHALALGATSGVSRSAMKAYKSQQLAVAAFNDMLQYHMVGVVAAN